MKKLIFILLVFFSCSLYAQEDIEVRRDTISPEVVSFDRKVYEELKNDKKFNYYEVKVEDNWWIRLRRQIASWLNRNLNVELTMKQVSIIAYSFLALIVILVIVFLYIYRPALFYRNKKRYAPGYMVGDEQIEGKDFDSLAKNALEREEYNDAIRWTYLKVLQTLNGNGFISFDPNKTVNEYVYEITKTELIPGFRTLTNQFIYFRYGNGKPDREICEEYIRQSRQLLMIV